MRVGMLLSVIAKVEKCPAGGETGKYTMKWAGRASSPGGLRTLESSERVSRRKGLCGPCAMT